MFEFETEDQITLRSSVRKFAEKSLPQFQGEPYYGTVPRELFKAMESCGLTGLSIPEQHGGSEAGADSTMITMEELAAVDLGPAVFLSVHTMVSGLISRFGSPAQRAKYLPPLARAEMLGAFALTEPLAGSDAGALRAEAVPDGTGFKLRGEKCFITSAGFADIYIVFARTNKSIEHGISAFLVESSAPGLVISKPEKKMGCELSPIASLAFKDIPLSREQLLGECDKGFAVALSGLAGGRVNIAACANGLSRAAINRAVKHLKERKQFGQALAEFQGLQFMLADMQMKLDAAELLTWQAAAALEKDRSARINRRYAAEAKCFATDAAMQITTDAVQLLGGAGYLKEYQVERLMRDAKMLQIVEGTNQIQRMLIAQEILGI